MSTDATDMSNPFRCRLCDQQYTRDNDLVAHFIQVHPNEKPYKCPRCNKSCAEAVRTLTRHYDYNEKCLALGEDSAASNTAAPAVAPVAAPSGNLSAAAAATSTAIPAPPLETTSDADEDEADDDQESGNTKADEDKEEEGDEEEDEEKKEQAKTLLDTEEQDILELIVKLRARLAAIRLQRKALE
ncbi:hypothetical protein IWZ01DRAFT_559869 [Phyllosticta capitalensis]